MNHEKSQQARDFLRHDFFEPTIFVDYFSNPNKPMSSSGFHSILRCFDNSKVPDDFDFYCGSVRFDDARTASVIAQAGFHRLFQGWKFNNCCSF